MPGGIRRRCIKREIKNSNKKQVYKLYVKQETRCVRVSLRSERKKCLLQSTVEEAGAIQRVGYQYIISCSTYRGTDGHQRSEPVVATDLAVSIITVAQQSDTELVLPEKLAGRPFLGVVCCNHVNHSFSLFLISRVVQSQLSNTESICAAYWDDVFFSECSGIILLMVEL